MSRSRTPRYVTLLPLSLLLLCCTFANVFGQDSTGLEDWYEIDDADCIGNLPRSQLNIIEWGIERIYTLFTVQVGDILMLHFRQPPSGMLTHKLASFDENGMFGWGLSISITFASQPDPSQPMYGYGWGTMPTYSEVDFSSTGYFTENGIEFTDEYTFDNNLHAQCVHYWALDKRPFSLGTALALERLRELEGRIDALESQCVE